MSDEPLPRWTAVRAQLREAVNGPTWEQWLAPLAPRRLDGATLELAAPEESLAFLAERFGRLLDACAASVLGPGTVVRLVPAAARSARTASAPAAPEPAADPSLPPPLNPRYTFDQFVIGESNRLAHAAALAVAEMPGLAYNPLLICGPPGLGKTHLLHSIANYVAEHGDGTPVRYATAESFTNDFVGALQRQGIDAFKAAYRDVGILLVDDVQFLQAKARTEEEFFHTFNALHGAGVQIVLTSDRPPRDLHALEDRLRERFEAGLVADIHAPDASTRRAILRKRVHHDGVGRVDPAALDLIADRVTDHVRALEAALIRVVAFGSLRGRPVTEDLAQEVLSSLYPTRAAAARPTVAAIQQQVADAYGVTVDQLLSKSRATTIAWPRQVAMYLARELTADSLPAIGKQFGGRNHTTVLHAYRRTKERMDSDAQTKDAVARIVDGLAGGGA